MAGYSKCIRRRLIFSQFGWKKSTGKRFASLFKKLDDMEKQLIRMRFLLFTGLKPLALHFQLKESVLLGVHPKRTLALSK